MTDINTNPSEVQGGHSLKTWLQSVTDPNKDPWTSEQLVGVEELECEEEEEEEEEEDHINPTLEREGEEDCVLVGGTDGHGRPEGNVSLTWSNGDSFKGQYSGGLRDVYPAFSLVQLLQCCALIGREC